MRSLRIEWVVVCLLVTLLFGAPIVEGQTSSGKSISGTLSPATLTAGSTVTLSGSASASATADANGNYSFTGLPRGTYTITPSKPGVRFQPLSQSVTIRRASSKVVNFSAVPVLQSLVISAPATSIAQGGTVQLTAIGTFSDGSTKNLTSLVNWTSSSLTVATVNSSGLVTGVGGGSTSITATRGGITSNILPLTVTVSTLQSITINGSSSSIANGTSLQLTATGTFSDGSTQNITNSVTWTSSNPGTATISAAGLVTGAGLGTSNITATQNGITSNTFVLTVTAATLQSINISAAGSSIAKGTSLQLTATGTFSDGTKQNLTNTATWSSSNSAIASITSSGLATGVDLGSTNITATQNGITSNSFGLTVTAAVLQSINVSASSSSIAKGTTVQFTAKGTFSDGSSQDLTNTATWTSSNPTIANINSAGLATASAIGSTNISAAQNGITSNSFVLTVTAAALQSITINAGSSSISKGTTVQFTATGSFTDGSTQDLTNTATWTSSNAAAVNISATGLATGEAIGSSNITATQSGVVSNSFAVAVTAATLQSITISASNSFLAKGSSVQFTATGTFSDGSTQSLTDSVTWASSSPVTVNISSTGIATGAAMGSSNIAATQNGITSNSVTLTVTAAALQSISISATSSSIAKGTSVQFTATGTFSDGSTQDLTKSATWTSSNPSTANISVIGLATGMGVGSTNITAAQNGITSNSFALTVTAAALQSIAVTAGATSLVTGSSEQLTATGTFSDGSKQNVTSSAIWSSSNPTAISLNTSAIALAAGIGQSVISASVGSTSATLTISATATISGAVTPASSVPGTTIALSGAASATTTPDASGNYSFTVLANGAYSVTPHNTSFTFVPPSASVTVNNANVAGINFTTGSGLLSLSPSIFSFGSVPQGTTAQIQATLTATGGDVIVTNDMITGAGFGMSGIVFPLTIAAGKSATFSVTFTPTSTAPASGVLSFTNGTTTLATANLSASGAGLNVSPSSLNFGQVPDATKSTPQVLTLTAIGGSVTLTSDNIAQNGGGGTAFSITGLSALPLTIAAGQSMQASVTFAPASGSPGPVAGTATFATSVNSVTSTLSGTGDANVGVGWSASTTPSVTYNVYRCSTSAAACVQTQPGNFSQIATGVGGLAYTDSTVSSGQTYYYALTAVDTTGAESVLSTVSNGATIP